MAKRGAIFVGIGGWAFAPWRGTFFPKGLAQSKELAHAAEALTAIEINGTFYRNPGRSTAEGWRDQVPEGFLFTAKAQRAATHRKVLAEATDNINRFVNEIAGLGDALGPILWQFDARKKFDADDFAAFLGLLPAQVEGAALRHAVDVRHESFCDAHAVTLARDHGVALVHTLHGPHPLITDVTADFAYVRLMGTEEGPPAGYSDEALDGIGSALTRLSEGEALEGAPLLAEPAKRKPRDVFAFVIAGHKDVNPLAAMALIERVGRPAQ